MMNDAPVIFGEVLFDCFEDGRRVLGGAPFNVAWHLQAFGLDPLLISRVGNDPMGREIRDTILHWGMNTAGLQLDSVCPSGEVKVTLQAGQPSFDILADRAYDHIDAGAIPPLAPSLIYHGSLALRQPESAAALSRVLQRYQAPVFMDVNLRSPWWTKEQIINLLDQSRWVKVNDVELETLVEEPGSLEQKAVTLIERHDLIWLIVTLGAKGAFSLDHAGTLLETRPPTETTVVDTVGAGDAFASVCIVGLLREWPQPLIIERAQQFGALLVGQRGATINDPGFYQSLIREWQLDQSADHHV
jgi:fructokinase